MYRYITTLSNDFIWGKNEITRETLAMVKDKRYDFLIDTKLNAWYDAENNEWKDIDGDK